MGQPQNIACGTPDGNDFQAMVMIEMNVLGGNNNFLEVMLQIRDPDQ
jgi:hypothetical protein